MKRLLTIALTMMLLTTAAEARKWLVWWDPDEDELLSITNGLANTNVFLSDVSGSLFQVSHGCLTISDEPFVVSTNYETVANATLTAGTITNTWFRDQTYMEFEVDAAFQIDFEFSDGRGTPYKWDFVGRIESGTSDDLKFQIFNYTNGVFTNFTDAADDLPGSTEDSDLFFFIPEPQEEYRSNGYSRIAITGNILGPAEPLFIDSMFMTYATATLTNAGTFYKIQSAETSISNNIGIDADSAEIITTSEGDYEIAWSLSYTGRTNTNFIIQHRTNDIPSGMISSFTINGRSDIESAAVMAAFRQAVGVTNSWYIRADKDDAFFTIYNGYCLIKKLAN